MRTLFYPFLLSIGILWSCEQKTNTEITQQDTLVSTERTEGCYQYSKDSSSVLLQIITVGNTVSGALSYDYYHKDKNTGTIAGEMNGDTLFATYIFMSEGVNAVREVAFLKKNNEWIEGYGEVQEDSAGVHFKNRHQLQFSDTFPLKKVSCEHI